MKKEIWKDVKPFEGLYQVSNTGKVKSLTRKVESKNGSFRTVKGQFIKPKVDMYGYPCVTLSQDGFRFYYTVHRLVATAFIPNSLNLPEVNHKNGDKLNNNSSNLEWCTSVYNMQHASKLKLLKGRKGENHHASKLNEEMVKAIRKAHRESNGKLTYEEIKKIFDISIAQISRIINNKQWTHL